MKETAKRTARVAREHEAGVAGRVRFSPWGPARMIWAALSGTGWEFFLFFPFFMGLWFVLILYLQFVLETVPEALGRWAKESGNRIVRKRRAFLCVPFANDPSIWRTIYRIEVLDNGGTPKTGWLNLGGDDLLTVSRIEVRWDEPPPSESNRADPQASPLWDRDLDS